MKRIVLALSLMLVTGCYRVTEEDRLRAVPVTNNPHLTPQTDSKLFRGLPY